MTKMNSDSEREERTLEARDLHSQEEEIELILGDGGEHLLSIFVSPGETLSVELERKVDGAMWRGDFTARYLEEITKKAGNSKSFASFVKMLRSALTPSRCRSPASSLQVDVLTHRDLIENLKHPIGNHNAAVNKEVYFSPPTSCVSNVEKRYLVLTYSNEFDLVHYSLPLLHEDSFSEVNGMRLCIKRLRHRVTHMKTRLQKYEACSGNFSRQSECVSPSSESKVRSDSDASSDSRFSDSRTSKLQMMENRALNAKVQGLEDKLRLERMSLNKSISVLSKRNASLEEYAKKAKERELGLCSKLSDYNFQMSLLRGKVKSQGTVSPRSASPSRGPPRMELTLRTDGSPSPRRTQGYALPPAYGNLFNGPLLNRALRSPYASPPHGFLENGKGRSPNSRSPCQWRQGSPSSLSNYGKIMNPTGNSRPSFPRQVSTLSSPPPKPFGQHGKFMDQELQASSRYGREKRYPFVVPPPASLSDQKRRCSPFISPPSRPRPYPQRAKFSSNQSSPRCQAPFLPSKSQMSSPRCSRGTIPQSSAPSLPRSQSCPILRAGEQEKPDFYTRRTRPRPRPFSPAPDLAALQGIKVIPQEEIITHQSSRKYTRTVDGVATQVGKIDSRLYALQDYLHRMNLDGRRDRL